MYSVIVCMYFVVNKYRSLGTEDEEHDCPTSSMEF